MEKLMKLIKEYGDLENLLGFEVGINKGASSQKAIDLRAKRTDKYIEVHTEILRISKMVIDKED